MVSLLLALLVLAVGAASESHALAGRLERQLDDVWKLMERPILLLRV